MPVHLYIPNGSTNAFAQGYYQKHEVCGSDCTTKQNDEYLIKQRITPVYVNGGKNYNQWKKIDRELLSVLK